MMFQLWKIRMPLATFVPLVVNLLVLRDSGFLILRDVADSLQISKISKCSMYRSYARVFPPPNSAGIIDELSFLQNHSGAITKTASLCNCQGLVFGVHLTEGKKEIIAVERVEPACGTQPM